MATDKPTSIRLKPEVREGVDRVAAAEHRSVSNTVNVLLTEALAARDAAPTRKES